MARQPEILVIDQDPQGRFEVKQLVKQAQLGFAGEAGFGTEAVSLASEVTPDVIFCGMSSAPERSLRTIAALLAAGAGSTPRSRRRAAHLLSPAAGRWTTSVCGCAARTARPPD